MSPALRRSWPAFIALGAASLGALFVYTFRARAMALPSPEAIPVLYATEAAGSMESASQVMGGTVSGAIPGTKVLADQFNRHTKEIYLSPDRKIIAVTVDSYQVHGEVQTYLMDTSGVHLTNSRPGSFVSWAPDSRSVLLFVSGAVSDDGREIYRLTADNQYSKTRLPVGTIAADENPVSGAIAYSLSDGATDKTDLRILDRAGTDILVARGAGKTFAWPRWSPDGKYLAYMAFDPAGKAPSNRQLWIVRTDGSGAAQAGTIVWNYPPQWYPDGSRLLYASPEESGSADVEVNGYAALVSNLWNYAPASGLRTRLTTFVGKKVFEPSISADGRTIAFISNQGGTDDFWTAGPDGTRDLVSGGYKRYPLLP